MAKKAKGIQVPRAGLACYGCGAQSDAHPWVAVINRDDYDRRFIDRYEPDAEGRFVGVPVCGLCHLDPAHRTAHAIKGHFFQRGDAAAIGLQKAGSSSQIGG